ncbi:DUF4349 domain-containing protein [Allostreptomyces psammosilenae]|uniref:DUF4349 domain-containing protein n=1 Tax=Allostreptomyces psammosilenae TaxID=1892865 RepID=A0A852ZLG9_9ACTN|nr:DUF4349 domain-containing protein [Allostreptomyces psammosilenae]NYI03226.1 hypothetical protein [Allostreptomyces psammosilenae]
MSMTRVGDAGAVRRTARRRRRRVAVAAAALPTALLLALTACAADANTDAAAGSAAFEGDAAVPAPEGVAEADLAEGEAYAPADEAAGTEEESAASAAPADPGGDARAGTPEVDAVAPARHVIHTASLSIETSGDLDDAVDGAQEIAVEAGGYVEAEETWRDGALGAGGQAVTEEHTEDHAGDGYAEDDYPTSVAEASDHSSLTLRIPPERYEAVLDDLAGLGEVVAREQSAEDVTGQVVDLDSRLASQRASVLRIQELMEQAESLSDVVMLEAELSSRQADLDSLLRQREALTGQTDLATVQVHLYGEGSYRADVVEDPDGLGDAFLDAFRGGWSAFRTAVEVLLVVLGAVLPFALVLGVPLFLVLRLRRNRRTATTGSATTGSAMAGSATVAAAGADDRALDEEPAVPASAAPGETGTGTTETGTAETGPAGPRTEDAP